MSEAATHPSSMFGTFNLRPDTDLAAFKQVFDTFCAHLQTRNFVSSWRVWTRAHHDGYDTRFPDTSVIVEMCFHSHQAALDSWDYIADHTQPVHPLHVAVNARVTNAYFVLANQI